MPAPSHIHTSDRCLGCLTPAHPRTPTSTEDGGGGSGKAVVIDMDADIPFPYGETPSEVGLCRRMRVPGPQRDPVSLC